MGEKRFVQGHASAAPSAEAGLEPELEGVSEQFGESHPPVAIIVASREESMLAEQAATELTSRGIDHEIHELSPVRTPDLLDSFLATAGLRGIRVIIATAGVVSWLPSMVATRTELPVIGVPLASSALGGFDSLLATAQAPPGMPVACMGVGNIRNAAIYAARILGAMPLPPTTGE